MLQFGDLNRAPAARRVERRQVGQVDKGGLFAFRFAVGRVSQHVDTHRVGVGQAAFDHLGQPKISAASVQFPIAGQVDLGEHDARAATIFDGPDPAGVR